jgi:hypothetical protein
MLRQKANATNAAAVTAMVVTAANAMVIVQSVLSVREISLWNPQRTMVQLRRPPHKLSLLIHAEIQHLRQQPMLPLQIQWH